MKITIAHQWRHVYELVSEIKEQRFSFDAPNEETHNLQNDKSTDEQMERWRRDPTLKSGLTDGGCRGLTDGGCRGRGGDAERMSRADSRRMSMADVRSAERR
ncbi:uncharacterized protein A4U43_C02F15900 [Asparagus officinalis]|uniref:Uncharacterized protein n=1 Tax=Asparagus officinalis TaxID=4686 RepID=A0A5P1FKH7_ASPOF|nr:uncharacterized protein A4U43_C02F15900 [Asparagus officinalis]